MKVLLAEDDQINRSIQKRMLERLGAEVDTAENGQAAVDAALQVHYDLILLDRGLPFMDGIQAARAIRHHEQGTDKKAPLVALTGGADDPEFYQAGMDGYLGKPITMDDLKKVLGKYAPKS